MFFYLKCKEDKICGFSSSVFLKEKTSYPSPVQDLAKERKVLSATKVLKCLTLSKNCGESPPEAHNFGYLPSPPFPFSYQAGTGAGFEKSQGVFFLFFFFAIVFSWPNTRSRSRRHPQGANKPWNFVSLLRAKPKALWQDLFFPKQRSAASTSKPRSRGRAKLGAAALGDGAPLVPVHRGSLCTRIQLGLLLIMLSSLPILKKALSTPPCPTTTAELFTTLKGNPMSQPLGAQGIMSGIPLSVTRPGAQSLSRLLSIHKYILFFCQGNGPRF